MVQMAGLTGHFSVGSSAIQLDSACAPNHFVP